MEPVGPLPPSVYRRRRAVALAVVVVLVVLIGWGVSALVGGSGSTGEDAAPVAGAPDPTPRPASFAAAEQAERARQADDESAAASRRAAAGLGPGGQGGPGGVGGDGRSAPRPPAGSATSAPQAPAGPTTSPSPPTLPSTDVVGRGLLPGAVLGPLPPPSSTAASPTPTPAPVPAPARGRAAAPRPTAPAPPRPTPAGPPERCPDRVLAVLARTDRPRYAAGERPVLSLVVRNTGAVPCVRDLDAARQAVAVVRRPGDGLWSSNDCAPGDTDDVRVLRPGQEAVFTVRWSGRTSRPGCPTSRETVAPGRYQLLARLDGMISEPAVFTLGG